MVATTEHAVVVFEIKEDVNNRPWLMANLDESGLSCLKGADFIGLHFRSDVTFEEAERFRAQISRMIEGVSLTRF